MKIVILGADGSSDVPGIEAIAGTDELAFAPDADALAAALPGSEVLLGWNFRGGELQKCWSKVDGLRWIQWCGAGVDAMLFPDLVASDVVLTNARGVFDRAMSEYVLALILADAKQLPQTLAAQGDRKWDHRLTTRVRGAKVTIVGVGSIARDLAEVLKCIGLEVTGVGRTARGGVPVFGEVRAIADLHDTVREADWVVGVLPGTDDTVNLFDGPFFDAMNSRGRFINIGRGVSVDEPALISALRSGSIAGAALDVFGTEPLTGDDPIWDAPNLIVSPHMSGDYLGYVEDIVSIFAGNLDRYRNGDPLLNVVDMVAGYVRD
jgi:phosphoglycerate dehydrogenase-like enzyme